MSNEWEDPTAKLPKAKPLPPHKFENSYELDTVKDLIGSFDDETFRKFVDWLEMESVRRRYSTREIADLVINPEDAYTMSEIIERVRRRYQ